MANQNKIKSFIAGKCPNCGQGNVFMHGPYHPKFINVNVECTHCKLKFEPETGFYFGAMYITYGINVSLIIIALILFNLVFEEFSPLYCWLTIVAIVAVSFNIVIRISRLLLLNMFWIQRS